jgi:hypothetical protein
MLEKARMALPESIQPSRTRQPDAPRGGEEAAAFFVGLDMAASNTCCYVPSGGPTTHEAL